jgi:hypothetical protein
MRLHEHTQLGFICLAVLLPTASRETTSELPYDHRNSISLA